MDNGTAEIPADKIWPGAAKVQLLHKDHSLAATARLKGSWQILFFS